MKKTFIVGLLISTLSLNLNSQNNKSKSSLTPSEAKPNTFKKGQLDLNIGIGLGRSGNYFYNGGSASFFGSSYKYTVTPPISVSLDYGITKNISIGGYLAFTRAKLTFSGNDYYVNGPNIINYNYTDTYSWNYYIVGVRAAFHFSEYLQIENLDLYGGIMLGNNFVSSKYTTTDTYNQVHNGGWASGYGGFIWGLYAGGRYMFTPKLGAFGEFGYGLSYATIGLNIKL